MSADWQPDEATLGTILRVLAAAQVPSSEVHEQVQAAIKEMNLHPDFTKYLCVVLSMTTVEAAARGVAGLLLKNNISALYSDLAADTIQMARQVSIATLGDPQPLVRSSASMVVNVLAIRSQLQTWPELFPTLFSLLECGDVLFCEGAVSSLRKICEDMQQLLQLPGFHEHVSLLVQKTIPLFSCASVKIAAQAITCLNQFILTGNAIHPGLRAHMDAFLSHLFSVADAQHKDIRRVVCQALGLIVEVEAVLLLPHMPQIIEYMLACTADSDEAVALEACEFWLALMEGFPDVTILLPYLDRLVPALLVDMKFSESELIDLGAFADETDAHVPDADTAIRPRHARGNGPASTAAADAGDNDDENDEDNDDENDDNDDDDDDEEAWTLRKCAALGLDALAASFQDGLLEILLPLLRTMLGHAQWIIRESAILAIGAIAEGCKKGMQPYLPELVPYLFSNMAYPQSLVRAISCWTLSRYSRWIVGVYRQQAPPDCALLPQFVELLLKSMVDVNKRVQTAACSAVAILEEEAGDVLVPFLPFMIETIVYALNSYQRKNLSTIYDVLGTLAESISGHLNNPDIVAKIMPVLFTHWDSARQNPAQADLFPLLECLTSVVLALGLGSLPYCELLFGHALNLVETTIHQYAVAKAAASFEDMPEMDYIVTSLDLISAVAEAIGPSVESLVGGSTTMQYLFLCCQVEQSDVRQSAFGLLGDLAKVAFVHVLPHIGTFMPTLVASLDPVSFPAMVCNNAAWAIGEISINVGEPMAQFAGVILPALVTILNSAQTPPPSRALLENSALALGRLALACPDALAASLPLFARTVCVHIGSVRDTSEKEQAFRGLCAVVMRNPSGFTANLFFFCDAICRWSPEKLKPDLKVTFQRILQEYKQNLGDNWVDFHGQFSPELKLHLAQRFGID